MPARAQAPLPDRGASLPTTPASQPWSPYGLEAQRVALLRRRQRLLLAGILLALLLVFGALVSSVRQASDVSGFGGNGSTVDLGDVAANRARPKPTTLTVSPGRTTVLPVDIQPEAPAPRSAAPPPVEGKGWNLLALAQIFGPPIGVAALGWRYGRRAVTGPLEEVNLGVYKGALPLELITSAHRGFVFNSRQAHRHLFGKGREDFVPLKPVVMGRARPAVPVQARPMGRFERVR